VQHEGAGGKGKLRLSGPVDRWTTELGDCGCRALTSDAAVRRRIGGEGGRRRDGGGFAGISLVLTRSLVTEKTRQLGPFAAILLNAFSQQQGTGRGPYPMSAVFATTPRRPPKKPGWLASPSGADAGVTLGASTPAEKVLRARGCVELNDFAGPSSSGLTRARAVIGTRTKGPMS